MRGGRSRRTLTLRRTAWWFRPGVPGLSVDEGLVVSVMSVWGPDMIVVVGVKI